MDYFIVPAPGGDERWHVRGGNDQVPSRVANRLPKGALAPRHAARGDPTKNDDGSYKLRFGGVAQAA